MATGGRKIRFLAAQTLEDASATGPDVGTELLDIFIACFPHALQILFSACSLLRRLLRLTGAVFWRHSFRIGRICATRNPGTRADQQERGEHYIPQRRLGMEWLRHASPFLPIVRRPTYHSPLSLCTLRHG